MPHRREIQQKKNESQPHKHTHALEHRETISPHTIAVTKEKWPALRPKVRKPLRAIHTGRAHRFTTGERCHREHTDPGIKKKEENQSKRISGSTRVDVTKIV